MPTTESIPRITHHKPPGPIARLFNLPFVGSIWLYRVTLSPFVGGQCKHSPSCSRYALEAYRVHGPIRGTAYTVSRIIRCNPFAGGGYDPVPLNEPPPSRADRDRPAQAAPTLRTDQPSMPTGPTNP